jgi:hypothetical protein
MEPGQMLANTSYQTKARPRPFDSVRKVICWYDKVVLRGPRDLTEEELDKLEPYCSGRPFTKRSAYRGYTLHMTCPDSAALMLARDLKFNTPYRIEVMANFITNEPHELRDYFREHLLLKFNRGNHHIDHGTTDYFHQWKKGKQERKRAPARVPAFYCDNPCKLTGADCLHVEDRIEGLQNIRRQLGIDTVTGMLEVDLGSYWASRLEFGKADLERLGRQALNQGRRRRASKLDRATGLLIRNRYVTLQQLVQVYGRNCVEKFEVDLEEILVRDLDMEELLRANGLNMLYLKGVRSNIK